MTQLWTSADIAAATGGREGDPFAATGVTFDSREVRAGDLFIAMRGETTDGHRYIARAIAAGAAGVVAEEMVDAPQVTVADSFAALQALARAARERTGATIIGVTGSAGKTGTKEALAAALERTAPGATHRSVKSYNNHTGVPLSLARMPAASRFGVLEMGMNHAGELSGLTRIVRPHVAVITTIAPAHQEFFDTLEAIADAKAEIFEGLEPGGTAIIPHDSPFRDRLRRRAEAAGANIVTFGLGEGADVRAVDWLANGDGGTLVTARVFDQTMVFTVSQAGEHWVANAMAVLAAVHAAGGDLAAAGVALAELPGFAGRGARTRVALPDGGRALIIDESYNANPASMRATITQLGLEDADRRIAVLGEMRELGATSADHHAALADAVLAAGVEQVLLVGEAMTPLGKALEGRVQFAHCADAAEATGRLKAMLAPGDAVLVKGSNAVGLSHLVAALTARGGAGVEGPGGDA